MTKSFLLASSALVFLSAISTVQAGSIEAVVVTASPIAGKADRFATIVDTVDRDQILQSGGENLADALKNIPGVTGTSFAGGASRPVIRGFDANRVRLLEDGIDSFDVSDVGPDHGVPIDPLSAQSIEVVRGAATLRYGSQAIGGVVNAINDRVPTSLPDARSSAEINAGYGTNGGLNQESFLLDARLGQLALHADGFAQSRGDYDIPGGTQGNSFFRGDGFSVGGSFFPTDATHMGAALIHYDSKYGIPSDTTYIDMRQTKVLTRSVFAIDEGALQTINVDGGYADYSHTEIDPVAGPLSTFNNRALDSRAEAVFGAMGPFSAAALGVQFQNRDFAALGEGADYLLPTHTQSGAIFAFVEAPLSADLHLQGGTRVEEVRVAGTPSSLVPVTRNYTPVSASAGVLFDASDVVKLGLTISSAARAPAQTELFAHGPHDGPGTFETGDPSLSIERANSVEATARVHLSNLELEGSAWLAKFSSYIYGELTGRTCDGAGVCAAGDSEELRELVYTQRDALFRGLEGKGTLDLGTIGDGSLSGQFIGDIVRAEFSGGENVPRIPPWRMGAGLMWSNEHFDASTMLMHSGRQDDLAPGETPTPGFNELDTSLSWRPVLSDPGITLSLIGHNLSDDIQRNAVALNKDVTVLPGRDIELMLDLKM